MSFLGLAFEGVRH